MTVMTIPRQRGTRSRADIVHHARIARSTPWPRFRGVAALRWLLIATAAAVVGGIAREVLFDALGDGGSTASVLIVDVALAFVWRRR